MMKVWGITDIGLVRRENQDAYAFAQAAGAHICVVCDGMGGTAGGRLASHIAVESYIAELSRIIKEGMTPEQLREASSYAVAAANRAVQEAAEASEAYHRMGTTLVAAVSYDGGVVVSNVGDSRAYWITEGGITQLTKDHSVVENMVARGDITAEEARHHPNRNLITRALGIDMDAASDGYICPVKTGEYILLCSDGLVGTVSDQEILFEVIHGEDPETCMDRLLAISKAHGAPDNVTIALMQML